MGLSIENWIVFTDLDGTLLDHESYDFSAALPALELLKMYKVPVVLTSSKTFVELARLAAALDLSHPLIGENGAYIAYPPKLAQSLALDHAALTEIDGYLVEDFGADYAEIRKVLVQLREEYGFRFRGFGDSSVMDVVAQTGLSPEAASDAMERIASEPLLWDDTDDNLARFREMLAAERLDLIRGGRFFHVIAPGGKGQAMHRLTTLLHDAKRVTLRSIALGDGPNDLEMLARADVAVVVKNPHSPEIHPQAERVIYTENPGPHGWAEAIFKLYNETTKEN